MKKIFYLLCIGTLTLNAQMVSTVAGSASSFLDGPTATAQFVLPNGISYDNSDNLIVTDTWAHKIRLINNTTNMVSTVAGSTQGFLNGSALNARFYQPTNSCIDQFGNIFVADFQNNVVRKISSGNVSTYAGSGAGYLDGPATSARFFSPSGIIANCNTGDVYVVDYNNHAIRKITPSGSVSTLAGGSGQGFADGTGSAAKFKLPYGIAIDNSGNLYIADRHNHCIRKVTPAGVVTTIAGTGVAGFANGPAAMAQFDQPCGLAVNSAGDIFVADTYNHKIRKISGGIVTTVAGTINGFSDGPALSSQFSYPCGLTIDALGAIYIADVFNYRIRKITPADAPDSAPGGITCPLVTALPEFDKENAVTIFPNPSSGCFIVKVSNSLTDLTMEISNSIGVPLFSKQLSEGETRITENLSAGIYYVTFIKKGSVSQRSKLVVQ